MMDYDICFDYMDNIGNIKEYRIIDIFHDNDKNYVIYKDSNKDDLHAGLCNINDDKIKIIPIINDEDYNVVDRYLESL